MKAKALSATKKKKSPSHKLSKDQQQEVLALIAQYNSPREISEYMESEHAIKISQGSIRVHYVNGDKWQETIQKYREKFEQKIGNERFSSKRMRLKHLAKIHDEAMIDKIVSENQFGQITKKDLAIAINALKESRTEIEGNNLNVTISPVQAMIDDIWDLKPVEATVAEETKGD